jgi:hypothetical protein
MPKNLIAFVDLRGKTPVDLLRMFPDKADDMIRLARRTWGLPSQLASAALLPLADRTSRRWLARTQNPYAHEIDTMAEVLGCPGVVTLNLSLEWGCTSGIWKTGESHSMLRVLDWPFPGIGRHVVIARRDGKAGEFLDVTWPGFSGVITAMAPGRFAACINQGPMRRQGLGFMGDWLVNRRLSLRVDGLPPAHLLRQVCEQAASYAEAKEMLVKTPLAVPATFVLGGVRAGEACVIERLENAAELFDISADYHVHAANHFESGFKDIDRGWWPREIDSYGRYRLAATIGGHELAQEGFGWLRAPIINANTRLCVIADPLTRRLSVQGYEASLPVTELFHMPPAAHEQQEAV